MTFKEYVSNRQARENPQGDFVRDYRADRNAPDVTSWAELNAYLLRARACPEAIDAGKAVWQSYTQFAKKRNAS